jgi:hypothetical protein
MTSNNETFQDAAHGILVRAVAHSRSLLSRSWLVWSQIRNLFRTAKVKNRGRREKALGIEVRRRVALSPEYPKNMRSVWIFGLSISKRDRHLNERSLGARDSIVGGVRRMCMRFAHPGIESLRFKPMTVSADTPAIYGGPIKACCSHDGLRPPKYAEVSEIA